MAMERSSFTSRCQALADLLSRPSDWDELNRADRASRHSEYSNGAPVGRRPTALQRIGSALKMRPRSYIGDEASVASATTRRKLKKKRRQSEPVLQPLMPVTTTDQPRSPEATTASSSPPRSRKSSFAFLRRRPSSNLVASPTIFNAPPMPQVVHPRPSEHPAQFASPRPRPQANRLQAVPPPRETFLPRSYSVPAMPAHFAASASASWNHDAFTSASGPSSEHAFSEDELSPPHSRRASNRWSRELSTFIGLEDDLAFQQAIHQLHEDRALDEEPESRRASVASFDAKACFIVRELLASEKSYLKHLIDLNTVRCCLPE
jgi:hypothetical protein